jgi:hypothetical protein
MNTILLEIILWIGGLAAVGSAVGVVVVLAGWWIVSRMAESVAAWLGHDETRNP